jgi:HEPN domain-containing protein
MTPEDLRRDQAARWLAEAAKDLRAAALLAAKEPSRSAFHSQQAVEKAAKGFLVLHDVPFRKTHDIGELQAQCIAFNAELANLLSEADQLTDYAVLFRYPDAPYEPDEAEAATAFDLARRVYEEIKTLLRV